MSHFQTLKIKPQTIKPCSFEVTSISNNQFKFMISQDFLHRFDNFLEWFEEIKKMVYHFSQFTVKMQFQNSHMREITGRVRGNAQEFCNPCRQAMPTIPKCPNVSFHPEVLFTSQSKAFCGDLFMKPLLATSIIGNGFYLYPLTPMQGFRNEVSSYSLDHYLEFPHNSPHLKNYLRTTSHHYLLAMVKIVMAGHEPDSQGQTYLQDRHHT